MKQITRLVSAAAFAAGLVLGAGPANAAIVDFVFDNNLGPDTSTASDILNPGPFVSGSVSLSVAGFSVSAGAASDLEGTDPFSTTDLTARDVIRDLSPANAGLGVQPSGSDNLEGSSVAGGVGDEVLIFDLGQSVTLLLAEFNGGIGDGHQDAPNTAAGHAIDFDIWTSLNGIDFTWVSNVDPFNAAGDGIVGAGAGVDAVAFSLTSQYFAISADAADDQGYVERLQFETRAVPEPASLGLMGLSLAVLGFAARSRRKVAA